ncbi:hypothetical protein SNEBB_000167 [Seison nebaliae]|nr:hypothetical protein SNEBB_000167 [Seison nebaliae]
MFPQILRNQLKTIVKRNFSSSKQCRSCGVVEGHPPLTIFSEDEEMMRDMALKIAQEEIAPFVHEMDKNRKMKSSVLKKIFESGLLGIEVEEKYGGSNASFTSTILAIESVSQVDASFGGLIDIQNALSTMVLTNYGNDWQKEIYLPKMVNETVCSFCVSEPSTGSDAFALKTKAEKVVYKGESGFKLNGTKCWISGAAEANLFLVMANAMPEKGYRGITCFLVERDDINMENGKKTGVIVGEPEKKLGLKASSTCMVTLDNCFIPENRLIDQVGNGYKLAISLLNESRIGIGAQMVGVAQGAYDRAVKYTLERKQFGQQIYDFQAIQHEISKAATDIYAARLIVYDAARRKEAGMSFVKEAAMAKYYASEMAGDVTRKCIDWMGGVGFTEDYEVEKYFRDAKIGTIYEGTSNMQLNTIGKIIKKEYE